SRQKRPRQRRRRSAVGCVADAPRCEASQAPCQDEGREGLTAFPFFWGHHRPFSAIQRGAPPPATARRSAKPPDPEGVKEGSRWLSAAIPPGPGRARASIPKGSQKPRRSFGARHLFCDSFGVDILRERDGPVVSLRS